MTFSSKIIADSISQNGIRLTTFEITFPRIVLAEFNTHRVFSRNSASSRAIPVEKMIRMVQENPYIPSSWGQNQRGMQAGSDVSPIAKAQATVRWLRARDTAVDHAQELLDIGIHKQLTNRLLEPFMWHTVIVTATEWSNFFHLRNNPMAHPDIQRIAKMMQDLYENSVPNDLKHGRWHLPLVDWREDMFALRDLDLICADADDYQIDELLAKVSVGRCARVSYLTHDGKRDLQADIKLHDGLLANGHMSPFEHAARPAQHDDWKAQRDESLLGSPAIRYAPELEVVYMGDAPYARLAPEHQWYGNFRGWVQYRKTIPGESDILG